MAKFRDRKCITCGKIEYNTATKSEVCLDCYTKEKKRKKRLEEMTLLESLGYTGIEEAGLDKHNHHNWTFIHECGAKQTWAFTNILKRVNADADHIPCSSCGGKRRMALAMEGYMEKYARTYDIAKFEDYRHKVRMHSNKVFAENQKILNPLGLKRSMTGYHLDHKVPVIICFFENIPIEVAGSVQNLQLLTAAENLSKCRGTYDDWKLVEQLKKFA